MTTRRRVEGSILFCDVRGFTALFDNTDPLFAFDFAEKVLGAVGGEVEKLGGTIDKFTGDGLLAHFGVRDTDPNHAFKACLCALQIQKSTIRVNAQRYSESEPTISVGVGISSGFVAYGTIATAGKAETSVFGDVVNTSSRIEGLTRRYFVDILLSKETAKEVDGKLEVVKLATTAMRGKSGLHEVYWLLPTNLV